MSDTKTCIGCERDLPVGSFAPIKSRPGRRSGRCRECIALYLRAWHAKNPGYAQERSRQWIADNAERWKDLQQRRVVPVRRDCLTEVRRKLLAETGAEVHGPKSDGVDKIYFVQEGDNGPVKIGWTQQGIVARMYQLQNGNPRPLRLIGVMLADRTIEEDLHAHFADLHVAGEWFEPAPSLLAFVAEVAKVPAVEPRRSAAGYRGVWQRKGRYVARIQVGKRHRYLGTFDTAEDAARAYDDEARAQFGHGAVLNFPVGDEVA